MCDLQNKVALNKHSLVYEQPEEKRKNDKKEKMRKIKKQQQRQKLNTKFWQKRDLTEKMDVWQRKKKLGTKQKRHLKKRHLTWNILCSLTVPCDRT